MLCQALFFKERVPCFPIVHFVAHSTHICIPTVSRVAIPIYHGSAPPENFTIRENKNSQLRYHPDISPTKLNFLQILRFSRLPFRKQEVQRGRVNGIVLLHKDNWDKAGHLSLSDILVLSIGGSSGRGLQKMLSSEKRPNTIFLN